MNLIDIDNYEGLYKFNKDLNQVYNVKTNKYIKNILDNSGKYYCVYLIKDDKIKTFRLNSLIYRYNNQDNPEDFVAIENYKDYKFNLKTNQVINIITGNYLKNNITNLGYYRICLYKNGKMKNFLLHRLIYQVYNPSININGLCIDHINQVTSDNDINNLRIATHSQNSCNKKIHKNNKLGIKNIFKNKSNTFTVVITKDKKKHSKNFKTLEEAIEYRDLKLTEMHGEFACYI